MARTHTSFHMQTHFKSFDCDARIWDLYGVSEKQPHHSKCPVGIHLCNARTVLPINMSSLVKQKPPDCHSKVPKCHVQQIQKRCCKSDGVVNFFNMSLAEISKFHSKGLREYEGAVCRLCRRTFARGSFIMWSMDNMLAALPKEC